MAKEFSFTKEERLLRPSEFVRARKEGRRYSTKSLTLHIAPNSLGIRRLGLSVGAHAGNSVARNRIKRLLREFFRQNKAFFPESSDILVSVKTTEHISGYQDAEDELLALAEALKGANITQGAPRKEKKG